MPAAPAPGTPQPALSSLRVPAGKEQVQVQIMEYDVEDVMVECVTAYKAACGEPDMVLKKVDTPFIATPEGGGGGRCSLRARRRRAGGGTATDRLFYSHKNCLRSENGAVGPAENRSAVSLEGYKMVQGVRQGTA